LYTRKVYLEYRQVFDKSMTFWMEPNPEVADGYLVKHHRGGVVFVGLIMHSKYMQTLKMVNIGVNVDSGSTRVCLVNSEI
jgi:hypothetical protein